MSLPPRVPLDLAREFLEALRAEYVRGEAEAVGRLYERRRVPSSAAAVLDPLEDQVRGAANRQEAIARLAAQWGLNGAGAPQLAAPVPPDLARDFLQALQAEYLRGEAAAVGNLYERRGVPARLVHLLDPSEDRVRSARDRGAAIGQIAAQWGMTCPPVGISSPAPSQAHGRPRRRRALLVGINYFGTAAELRGCINDVHNLRALLVQTFGWEPACIQLLIDDNPSALPTRANIEQGMRWLVEDVRPGDCLFLHFSGHGAQEVDPNGFEEDGMHETILPLDFQRAGMITDDHINDLVVKPLPEGVRLTAVMDCCHSGTGLDLPCIYMGRGWREETNPFHTVADVQLFSGCDDDDTSADAATAYGQAGGAMTTAFCDVLREDRSPSYPNLMARLHTLMRHRGFSQRPRLTSSQAFHFDRPFHLEDALPNSNRQLGRIFRRRFPPRPRPLSGPLAGMLQLGAAAVGGLVVGSMLESLLF